MSKTKVLLYSNMIKAKFSVRQKLKFGNLSFGKNGFSNLYTDIECSTYAQLLILFTTVATFGIKSSSNCALLKSNLLMKKTNQPAILGCRKNLFFLEEIRP